MPSVIPSVFVEWSDSLYTSGAEAIPFVQPPEVYDIGIPYLEGALTDNLPNAALPDGHGGAVAASPVGDVYDTIWVVPGELRVGSITATTQREVEVWNAYRTTRQLDDILVTAGEGIDVSGPTLPYTFAPLENFILAVAVHPDGPASIDARYDLDFATAEGSPHFTVVGQRIIQWSIAPNWQHPYEETLACRTEILEAFDGSEQRIALRHLPRRTLAFTPLVDGEGSRRANRLLSTWQNRNYAMADWARGVGFAGLPAGAEILELDETMPELEVGQLIVLRGGGNTQAIEVADIVGTTVTLNSPTAYPYPAGSVAYPGLIVHADASLSARRYTAAVGEMSLAFTEMHQTGQLDLPAAPVTWRDREVFLARPNWVTRPQVDHRWAFEWLDSGRGQFATRTPHDAPKDIRKFAFTLEGRDAVRAIEQFFLRMRGRRGECYAPTQDDDLPLPAATTLLDGSQALPIRDIEDADRMDAERVYRNVYVRLTDGTELFRQVTGADLSEAENPKLALDAAWPRTIEAHEVAKCCWLPRCRLASDELRIRWITAAVAETTLAFQVLEDL
ncbi:hypothetical protein [Halomonas stenophila]|uniref:Uncharacterized protein n=1 Tax=Halomonas stenophila TaxID=795312 RepID=A0A7W5HLY1_9GAMM|nr:hypothetical protein [Halomonas stenophila]MBB3231699.1 hypothetical protein [Halomonas stenophila]